MSYFVTELEEAQVYGWLVRSTGDNLGLVIGVESQGQPCKTEMHKLWGLY